MKSNVHKTQNIYFQRREERVVRRKRSKLVLSLSKDPPRVKAQEKRVYLQINLDEGKI